MLLTGDLIDGTEAKAMGLVIDSVPEADLDARVEQLAQRMAAVPKNQLMMQKLMVNQAFDNMGLQNTQMLATLFDGMARHTPGRHVVQGTRRDGGLQASGGRA